MPEIQTVKNYAQYLDDNLYTPLEALTRFPYPLRFSRVGNLVLLQEGPYTSTILERCSYSRDASWFSFQISFMNHGIEDPGWLFQSKASFFLVYCPYYLPGEDEPSKIRALLVPRLKLLHSLELRGFNRAILAGRADLIRRGGKGGVYQSADPDIAFSFWSEGERRPIDVRIQASALEKIATGDFTVSIGEPQEPLKGHWLDKKF